MRLLALFMLALTGVSAPAFAQDRTPPNSDLRVFAPPIDWRASQMRSQRSDFYGLANEIQKTTRRSGNAQPAGQ